MPLRSFFKRSTPLEHPDAAVADRGFRDASVIGAKPIEVPEVVEHELSEISDSGVFLPPSTDRKSGLWYARSNSSFSSSSHRNANTDNEPFNISRESFDSYRRSFDISGRSTISDNDPRLLHSLDSSGVLSTTDSLESRRRTDWPEEFEDVKLNDENRAPTSRRKGFFSRFGDSSPEDSTKPTLQHHSFILGGRKHGQNGQGSELASISRTDELAGVVPALPSAVESGNS